MKNNHMNLNLNNILILFAIGVVHLLNGINAANLIANVNILDELGNGNVQSLLYYWTNGDTTQRVLNVQLTLSIDTSPPITSFQLTQAVPITVSCQLLPGATNTNYDQATFTANTVSVTSSTASVSLSFTITTNGKETSALSCTASSSSFTQQTINNVPLTQIVFVQPTAIPFNVRSFPTIAFDSTSISISPFTSASSTLNVYFSDRIVFYPVTLTCTVLTNANILSLDATIRTVSVGSTEAQIKYTLNADLPLTSTVQVSCTAQTTGATVPYLVQYSASTPTTTLTPIQPQINIGLNTISYFTGSGFNFTIELTPVKPNNRQIVLQCGLRNFKTLAELQASTPATNVCPSTLTTTTSTASTSTTTTTTPSSDTYDGSTFDWYLLDFSSGQPVYLTTVTFASSSIGNLAVRRNPLRPLRLETLAFLSVVCCDTTLTTVSTLTYSSQPREVVVTAMPNQDPTQTKTNSPNDYQLLDPGYYACNCDLKVNVCDVNCCCDADCTDADKKAFDRPCLNQIRPIFDETVNQWYCTDIYNAPILNASDWYPIICIHTNTTVLLGKYYSPEDLNNLKLNNFQQLINTINQDIQASYNTRSEYLNDPLVTNYASTNLIKTSKYCSLGASNSDYVTGSCLITTTKSDSTVKLDFLRFPQNIYPLGTCDYNAPLKFLNSEGKSFCKTSIDTNSCNAGTRLDLKSYNLQSNMFVFKSPQLTNKVTVRLEYYKCPNYPSVSYESTLNPPVTPNPFACTDAACTFNTKTTLFDNDISGICSGSIWTYNPNMIQNIPVDFYSSSDVLATCGAALADATAISSVPTQQAGTCQNAVTGVKYLLFWKGGVVDYILARVIISDVALGTSVRQQFEIEWVYENTASFAADFTSVTSYENYAASSPFINAQLSGVQGYSLGQPIISGYKSSTSDSTVNVDISYDQRISTYSILNSKICGTLSNLERDIVQYGVNTSTSCFLQITQADLTSSCSCLRRIIFDKLNTYFVPSSHVSINGNPNMQTFTSTDWAPIYPSSRTLAAQNSQDQVNDINVCKQVPYKLNLILLTATNGRSEGVTQNQIVGAYIFYSYIDWTFDCRSNKANCLQDQSTQNFRVEFETSFISIDKRDLTWWQQCMQDESHSACIQQVLYTWPRDYQQPNFFYLYQVQLGLIFGMFGLIVVYVMLFGATCAC